jgi:hypothetical protein
MWAATPLSWAQGRVVALHAGMEKDVKMAYLPDTGMEK